MENDLRQGLITTTSPLGRKVTTQYDPNTLLVQSVSVPGLLSANTEYDSRGRVNRVATGTRSLIYSYNNQGLLETITDADNRTTTFAYDPVGRVKTVYRPDSTYGFTILAEVKTSSELIIIIIVVVSGG